GPACRPIRPPVRGVDVPDLPGRRDRRFATAEHARDGVEVQEPQQLPVGTDTPGPADHQLPPVQRPAVGHRGDPRRTQRRAGDRDLPDTRHLGPDAGQLALLPPAVPDRPAGV
ncbi:MAG: hypothetical protein AVDCRST_MAG69-2368, partial [uncultured Solirubrobacteraceae bacterium]